MVKKILLISILSFTFLTNTSFAVSTSSTIEEEKIDLTKNVLDAAESAVKTVENSIKDVETKLQHADNAIADAEKIVSETTDEKVKAKAEAIIVEEKKLKAEAETIIAAHKNDLNNAKEATKGPEHNYNQALLSGTAEQKKDGAKGLAEETQAKVNEIKQRMNNDCNGGLVCEETYREELEKAESELKTAQQLYTENNKAYVASDESNNDITSAGYQISVNDISPGMKVTKGDTVKQSINYTLGRIIQMMMMLLGSLALLVMTIGAGFMILHHGQDELLSKGKSIFMSGVISLIVALSSYYLIAIFRYILFTGNN